MNPCLIPPSRLARLTVLRTQSDERLMFLVGHGSEPAFEAIVQRYRRSLVKHCGRVLGTADAEEAVQDGLVNAHAALVRGADVRSLGPWLHTVAHNAALSILRRRLARPECSHEEISGSVSDAPHAIRAELQDLVRAVQALPPRQRDAIVMRELEGRSYSEIAARLGASDGAVRQLLNRARIAMRKSLGALIPAGPLARSVLATGDGGPAIAAKLSGAAVVSALSAIAIMPSTHPATKPRAARVPSVRPRRIAVIHAPRHALARVSMAPRRATRSVERAQVSTVHQAPLRQLTSQPKNSRPQPRSTSAPTGPSSQNQQVSASQQPPVSWTPGASSTSSSSPPRPMYGSGSRNGSPDEQEQPIYEMPMQPNSSWPQSQQSSAP